MNRKQIPIVWIFIQGLAGLILLLLIYVWYTNRNSADMTFRQKLIKAFYPALMKIAGNKKKILASYTTTPIVSFYTLEARDLNGNIYEFSQFKGKKVLLVNTASDCGFTPQYAELEKLYELKKNELIILAFPSNDYKQQEKGTDQEIAGFCSSNYGLTFPVMQKCITQKKEGQHTVYQWLTDPKRNGWNDQAPGWNFSKYLIDEEGKLIGYFDPAVSPLDKSLTDMVDR